MEQRRLHTEPGALTTHTQAREPPADAPAGRLQGPCHAWGSEGSETSRPPTGISQGAASAAQGPSSPSARHLTRKRPARLASDRGDRKVPERCHVCSRMAL